MTDETRNRLRNLQDRLLELAEAKHVHLDLQISSHYVGSPTLRELYHSIFPEWENAIKDAINYLENER